MEIELVHVVYSNLRYIIVFDVYFLECPLGFFGKDCAKKCSFPFYGEDCQSTCLCPKNDCHVSRGCSTNFETFIYQKIGSPTIYVAKPSTITVTQFVSISNKDFSNPTVSQDFSTDIRKQLSDDKVDTYNSSSDNWLKNSVALSLFGIFVLFFSVFVIAYIYLKCFRKGLNAGSNKNTEWQVKYRSLSLDTRQPMGAAYVEPQEEMIVTDSTYLSPVFSRNGGNEISSNDSNDVSRETTGGGHVPAYSEDETNISLELEQRTYYVYTEITENGTESSNVSIGCDCKHHVSSNTESSTAMDKEVSK